MTTLLVDDVRPDARVERAPVAERLDDGESVGSFVDLIAQRTHDAYLNRVRGEPVACHVEPFEKRYQVGEEIGRASCRERVCSTV